MKFHYFYRDKETQQYIWQIAQYIEDGEYISTKDFKTFSVWSIPQYGGEEYLVKAEIQTFEDAVKIASNFT